MNIQWQAVLEKAIRDGNQVHDKFFYQEGVTVTVEDGFELAGDHAKLGRFIKSTMCLVLTP